MSVKKQDANINLLKYIQENIIQGRAIGIGGSLAMALIFQAGEYTRYDGTKVKISKDACELYKSYIEKRDVGDVDLFFIDENLHSKKEWINRKINLYREISKVPLQEPLEDLTQSELEQATCPKVSDIPNDARPALEEKDDNSIISIHVLRNNKPEECVKLIIDGNEVYVSSLEKAFVHKVINHIWLGDIQVAEKLFEDFMILYKIVKNMYSMPEIIEFTKSIMRQEFCKDSFGKEINRCLSRMLENYRNNKFHPIAPSQELIDLLTKIAKRDVEKIFDSKVKKDLFRMEGARRHFSIHGKSQKAAAFVKIPKSIVLKRRKEADKNKSIV